MSGDPWGRPYGPRRLARSPRGRETGALAEGNGVVLAAWLCGARAALPDRVSQASEREARSFEAQLRRAASEVSSSRSRSLKPVPTPPSSSPPRSWISSIPSSARST